MMDISIVSPSLENSFPGNMNKNKSSEKITKWDDDDDNDVEFI